MPQDTLTTLLPLALVLAGLGALFIRRERRFRLDLSPAARAFTLFPEEVMHAAKRARSPTPFLASIREVTVERLCRLNALPFQEWLTDVEDGWYASIRDALPEGTLAIATDADGLRRRIALRSGTFWALLVEEADPSGHWRPYLLQLRDSRPIVVPHIETVGSLAVRFTSRTMATPAQTFGICSNWWVHDRLHARWPFAGTWREVRDAHALAAWLHERASGPALA